MERHSPTQAFWPSGDPAPASSAIEPEGGHSRAHYLDWASAGRSSPLLYLLALILGFLGMLLGGVPLALLLPKDPGLSFLQLPFAFLGALLLCLLLVRLLLGRPWWTVGVPRWPPAWTDYLAGVIIGWLILASVLAGALALKPGFTLEYRGFAGLWGQGIAVPLMLAAGYFVQTLCEEVYFRGLMMQAVRRLTRLMPVVIAVPAYVFASHHGGNLKGFGSGFLSIAPYFIAGLYLGWTAWRSGSLLLPAGLHFTNNSWGAFLVNTRGDVVATPAPFIGPPIEMGTLLWVALFQAVAACAAAEWWVRRRARQ